MTHGAALLSSQYAGEGAKDLVPKHRINEILLTGGAFYAFTLENATQDFAIQNSWATIMAKVGHA